MHRTKKDIESDALCRAGQMHEAIHRIEADLKKAYPETSRVSIGVGSLPDRAPILPSGTSMGRYQKFFPSDPPMLVIMTVINAEVPDQNAPAGQIHRNQGSGAPA